MEDILSQTQHNSSDELLVGFNGKQCGETPVWIPEWLPQYIYQKNRETGGKLFES